MHKPNCMTQEQYETWLEAAKFFAPTGKSGICEDCTPEYQAEHKADFTCSHPLTIFVKCRIPGSDDQEVVGFRAYDGLDRARMRKEFGARVVSHA